MMTTIATAAAKPARSTDTAAAPADDAADAADGDDAFDQVLACIAGLNTADDEPEPTDACAGAVPPLDVPPLVCAAVFARPVIVTPPAVAAPGSEAIEEARQSIEAEWQAALPAPVPLKSLQEAAVAALAQGQAPAREEAPATTPTAGVDLSGALRSTGTAHDPSSAARHTAPLASQVGTPGWSDELAARVVWLAKDDVQGASLRLSPAHLGPLEVHIAVRGDEATVSFGASHADTRAALEQALPRLREMFASQGLHLTQADVSGRDPREAQTQAAHHALRGLTRGDAQESGAATPARVRVGLLDLYA